MAVRDGRRGRAYNLYAHGCGAVPLPVALALEDLGSPLAAVVGHQAVAGIAGNFDDGREVEHQRVRSSVWDDDAGAEWAAARYGSADQRVVRVQDPFVVGADGSPRGFPRRTGIVATHTFVVKSLAILEVVFREIS